MTLFKQLLVPSELLNGATTITGNEKRKIMYNHIQYLMGELEKLLQKEKTLTEVNKRLINRIQENKKQSVTEQEYDMFIDMIVRTQIDFEAQLYEERLAPRIRGGFIHESPF